jgi:hypothetical protein
VLSAAKIAFDATAFLAKVGNGKTVCFHGSSIYNGDGCTWFMALCRFHNGLNRAIGGIPPPAVIPSY